MWSAESTGCCPETSVPVWLSERDEKTGNVINTHLDGAPPTPADVYQVKNWYLAYLEDVKAAIHRGPIARQLSSAQPMLRVAAAANECLKCRSSFGPSFSLFVEVFKKRVMSEVSGNLILFFGSVVLWTPENKTITSVPICVADYRAPNGLRVPYTASAWSSNTPFMKVQTLPSSYNYYHLIKLCTMANTDNQAERRGPRPFDADTGSDLIIRSSDGFNFYVKKSTVEGAFPVLEAMLSAPHPPKGSAGPGDYFGLIPVMEVGEGHLALNWLLRCCYANGDMPKTRIYNIQDALDLLHCWDKYHLQIAYAEGERALLRVSEQSAFAAFAVACKYRLRDLAVKIINQAYSRFTFDDEMARFLRIDNRTAKSLLDLGLICSLWSYQDARKVAAKSVLKVSLCVDEDSGRDRLPMWSQESTRCCPETLKPVYRYLRDDFDQIVESTPYNVDCPDQYYFKNWFVAYLQDVEAAIDRGPVLDQLTPTQPALRAAAAANDCPKCRTSFESSFALFVDRYKERAKYEVSQACKAASVPWSTCSVPVNTGFVQILGHVIGAASPSPNPPPHWLLLKISHEIYFPGSE